MIAIFPELASCAVSGDVERLAILARVYFGGEAAKSPQIDPRILLNNAGVKLSSQQLNYYAAVVAKDDNGQFEISVIYRDDLLPEEIRFNLAHCLGHILLDIEPKVAVSGSVKMGFKEDQPPVDRYCGVGLDHQMPPEFQKKEELADEFAAALLMPKAMLQRAIEKLEHLDKVAKFFNVSTGCLERRLESIGFKNRSPENFIEAERDMEGTVKDIPIPSQPTAMELRQSLNVGRGAKARMSAPKSKTKSEPIDRQQSIELLRQEIQNANVEASHSKQSKQGTEPGISRIRELARQIDHSVPK